MQPCKAGGWAHFSTVSTTCVHTSVFVLCKRILISFYDVIIKRTEELMTHI